VESHASVASRARLPARTLEALREDARRLYSGLDLPITLAVAAVLAAIAFVANGGLQLGSSTLVEAAAIAIAALLVAAALVCVGFEARVHGGMGLAGFALLAGITGLSILWSLYPSDSWVETNRTLAYVAAFTAGIACVRLARARWPAIAAGVLLAITTISLWGLATKVAPAWLAPDEVYARLREPYGYWNAVGVTAAMGMPLCLWLGTRPYGRRAVNAIAWPLLALFAIAVMLSFSRGSVVAAVIGTAVWLAVVPLRLRSLALLVPAVVAAAAVTAWAFSQSALTDDRIALADRKDAGVELGLILVVAIALLYALGTALQLRAERRPFSQETRRRIGTAAIAVVAVTPLFALAALAFTDRGIGGTVSDRWHDLTSSESTPANEPGRLTETSSVRSIYWRRAIDVWEKHRVAGAGAGSFAEAQLRFRHEPAHAKHAHGYVVQTLADLGLVGLAVSLFALGAWALAARETLALRRGRMRAGEAWPAERVGLAALALVAIVFGVHSTLDWTWFVPAVAITAFFCAGWVAGRGPLAAADQEGPVQPLATVRAGWPPRERLRLRAGGAVAVTALALVTVLAVIQPWRAEQRGEDALGLAATRDFDGGRSAARSAHDINRLSPEPYFDLAAVEDAAGNRTAAVAALERAVQVEPASAEAWRRLGEYELSPLGHPERALPLLRGAIFLDPQSAEARTAFLAALRARSAAAAAERRRTRRTGGESRGRR
jgi:tetratricopeptide (TPR) repeat protein